MNSSYNCEDKSFIICGLPGDVYSIDIPLSQQCCGGESEYDTFNSPTYCTYRGDTSPYEFILGNVTYSPDFDENTCEGFTVFTQSFTFTPTVVSVTGTITTTGYGSLASVVNVIEKLVKNIQKRGSFNCVKQISFFFIKNS
jgi:hypothetical protein